MKESGELYADDATPEDPWATILCAVDVATQNPLAIAVPGKSAEMEYVTRELVAFTKRLGFTDLVVRSDGEGAITALVDRMLAGIKKEGIEAKTKPEKTPRYSSASLGAVGSMQSAMQGQVRTLKTDLELKLQKHVQTNWAAWAWMVRHAAWLLERFQMRANGRTSFEDCFGLRYAGIVLHFGETAVFRHPVGSAKTRTQQTAKQLKKEKASNKMDIGVWLGKAYDSDEHYMGTSDGVFTCRTCRRLDRSQQWDAERVMTITGVPWDMGAGKLVGRPRLPRIQVQPALPAVPAPTAAAASDAAATEEKPTEEPPEEKPTAKMPEGQPKADSAEDPAPRAPALRRALEFDIATPAPAKRVDRQASPLVAADAPMETKGAKREAEIPVESLDPAAQEDLVVGALETVDAEEEALEYETDNEDADWDTDSAQVDDNDAERSAAKRAGRLKELQMMAEFGLTEVILRQKARDNGWRILKSKWVDTERPKEWRCRRVVKDFRSMQPWRRDLFTPSSLPMTNRLVDAMAEANGWPRMVADATNAYFHAAEDEDICGEMPDEALEDLRASGDFSDYVWKFLKKCYGRRCGSLGFCDYVAEVLDRKALTRCEALPCFYRHETLKIFVELHQDDFHCTAPGEGLRWLRDELKGEIRLKFSEVIGPGTTYSHLKATRLVTDRGTMVVASRRYIDDILKAMGMETCAPAPTPITTCRAGVAEEDGELLEAADHATFRRVVGIARFLRTLRPDIGYTVKELSHRLSAPRQRDLLRCKRLARYLSGTRDMGIFMPRGRERADDMAIVGYSDSDWAGDKVTRKSTSSGVIWWGPYLVADLCKGQSVVATSSGEAELYAAVSTLKDMILIQRVLVFAGYNPRMELRMDSSAARSMLERQGVGKVRHIEVAVLWAQQWVKDRRVQLAAEPGSSNCADLNTKVHGADKFKELVARIGLTHASEFAPECGHEAKPVAAVSATTSTDSPLLALMAFLSQLVPAATSELCVPTQAVAANRFFEDQGEGPWQGASLLAAVLLTAMLLSLVAGCAMGWCMARCATGRPRVVVQESRPEEVETREVETQSQVTYRRELTTPRFQPLGDYQQGAWPRRR